MTDNPLQGTVCMQLMCAGIRGPEDTDPVCMGSRCACFFTCLHSVLEAQEGITKIRKHTGRSRS